MTVSQSALAWLYLYAVFLGIGLGAFYDLFRITRVFLGMHYSRRAAKRLRAWKPPLLKPIPKRRENPALGVVMFVEDLLFCMVAGILLVILFYEVNSGRFRFPALISVGAGFLLYRGTLGRIVMLFSEVIAFAVELFVRYLCYFIWLPISLLLTATANLLKRGYRAGKRNQQRRSRRRYTAAQASRSTRDACGLLPQSGLQNAAETKKDEKNKIRKGRKIQNGSEKEAIQPLASHARAARRAGGGFHRRVCK